MRDPEGMVHMLGDIEGRHDFTECRRKFTTKGGWKGLHPDTVVDVVCAKCVEALIAAYRRRMPLQVQTFSNADTITITDCWFHDPPPLTEQGATDAR